MMPNVELSRPLERSGSENRGHENRGKSFIIAFLKQTPTHGYIKSLSPVYNATLTTRQTKRYAIQSWIATVLC